MNNHILNRQSITVKNNTSECDRLSAFLAEYESSNNIPDEIHHDLRLVLEEVFVNITNYAFSSGEKHTVSIEISSTSNAVSITFIDAGIAFNPLLDCNHEINTENHCEGGMGIQIIKSLTDQQEYNRIKQHNVFTVTRNYSKHDTKKN